MAEIFYLLYLPLFHNLFRLLFCSGGWDGSVRTVLTFGLDIALPTDHLRSKFSDALTMEDFPYTVDENSVLFEGPGKLLAYVFILA